MRCLSCKREDGRTKAGGLLCHDCEEAGAEPRDDYDQAEAALDYRPRPLHMILDVLGGT